MNRKLRHHIQRTGIVPDADMEQAWEAADREVVIAKGITGGRVKYRRPSNPLAKTLASHRCIYAFRRGAGASN